MANAVTLRQILAQNPPSTLRNKILSGLEYEEHAFNPDRKVTIGYICRINGVTDAIWCLRCLDDKRDIVRAFIHSVKRTSGIAKDDRVTNCVSAIFYWLRGDDNIDLAPFANAAFEVSREKRNDVFAKRNSFLGRFGNTTWFAEAGALAAEAACFAARAAQADSAEQAAVMATCATDAAALSDEKIQSAQWVKDDNERAGKANAERKRQAADLIAIFGIADSWR